MTLKNQEKTKLIRVGVYIDGFNLYHPIDKLYQDFMKWLNLWKLSENLCTDENESVVKVVFCTALPKNEPDRHDRHSRYIGVLEGAGVEVVRGHRMGETKTCMHCNRPTEKQIEKQSDINVALMLILDAEDDLFDRAYLLSADSDQAATARVFKNRFPDKTLYNAVPPGQEISNNVRNHATKCFSITEDHIERSLFR